MNEDDATCARCGEGDGPYDDVVAHFWDPMNETTVLAHVDCADEGWRLA